MKIVVLDGYTENPGDLSWDALRQFGDLTVYDRTSYEESPLIAERMQGADIVVMNKTPISRQTIDRCPDLKLIAVLALILNVMDCENSFDVFISHLICIVARIIKRCESRLPIVAMNDVRLPINVRNNLKNGS